MLLASRSIPIARPLLLALVVAAVVVLAALVVVAALWGPSLAHLVQSSAPFRAGPCPGAVGGSC